MHKTTKKLSCAFKKRRAETEDTNKKEREEEKNAKRRSVGSFSRFSDVFATLFSPLLSSRPSRLLVVFSLLEQSASPISHPIVFLARFALLGFQTREREKREGIIKVVLRSSTLIIIIKYDQTRHQRRIQVAEIRSEEHQIGLVPEKLLPMHETGLSSQEASGKRTREVRKPAQSRETELVIAQSAEKQVTAAERYHRHTQQGGKEEE